MQKNVYRTPTLRLLGRMNVVRAKSTGIGDGGGNDKKNVGKP